MGGVDARARDGYGGCHRIGAAWREEGKEEEKEEKEEKEGKEEGGRRMDGGHLNSCRIRFLQRSKLFYCREKFARVRAV